jgi:hypothetical protein
MRRRTVVILLTTAALAFACSHERCAQPEAEDQEPFRIEIYPETIRDAAPTQNCVFLVEFKNVCQADSIYLSARVLHGGDYDPTIHIPISTLEPGWIGEVEVRIAPFGEGNDTLTVIIQARSDSTVVSDTCAICVSEGWGDPTPYATEVLREFVTWIEYNEPGLGITPGTSWKGTIVVPHICCAGHYLFFSRDWEMGLMWIIHPPPGDGVRMYLRRRHTETTPSYALTMSSWEERTEPTLTHPPDAVTR